jgi:hypothetical protein
MFKLNVFVFLKKSIVFKVNFKTVKLLLYLNYLYNYIYTNIHTYIYTFLMNAMIFKLNVLIVYYC